MAKDDEGPVEVRARVSMEGLWHGNYNVKRGDVFTVPTRREALRCYRNGTAQPSSEKVLGRPHEPYVG